MTTRSSRTAMVAAVLAAVLLGATSAQAASREVITGDVLRLVSVQDATAMRNMSPGETASWDVRVGATETKGQITLLLAAGQTSTGTFQVSVHSCQDEGQDCTTALLPATVLAPGEEVEVGEQAAAATTWYRISVQLAGQAPAQSLLTFTARGHGEEVSTDGEAQLPETGTSPWLPAGLAAGALLVGTGLARLAALRRKKSLQ